MGFRRAIVPAGTDAIPADSPDRGHQVADVAGAISAAFGAEPQAGRWPGAAVSAAGK